LAELKTRAVIAIAGPDWRAFLQALLSQDVESLASTDLRFAALLTPQGRLLNDLFLIGRADGCLLDCAAESREALIARLTMYRLRARVEVGAADTPVRALWNAASAPEGWSADPRVRDLGFRGYGLAPPAGAVAVDEATYEAHRLAVGVPGQADFAFEPPFPIEANFDLLNGIDFRKGCYVGQETTSRMKRRGTIKSRMAPIAFDGPTPDPGSELLSGTLRAGRMLTGVGGRAMALVRLDRLEAGPLALADGRPWRLVWPEWLAPTLATLHDADPAP
jgi:hypothetical protein